MTVQIINFNLKLNGHAKLPPGIAEAESLRRVVAFLVRAGEMVSDSAFVRAALALDRYSGI